VRAISIQRARRPRRPNTLQTAQLSASRQQQNNVVGRARDGTRWKNGVRFPSVSLLCRPLLLRRSVRLWNARCGGVGFLVPKRSPIQSPMRLSMCPCAGCGSLVAETGLTSLIRCALIIVSIAAVLAVLPRCGTVGMACCRPVDLRTTGVAGCWVLNATHAVCADQLSVSSYPPSSSVLPSSPRWAALSHCRVGWAV
jgi:hypothetical protein